MRLRLPFLAPRLATRDSEEWEEISSTVALWKSCKLLIVTPRQYPWASTLIDDALIECIDHPEDLNDLLMRLRGRRYPDIGIMCPRIGESLSRQPGAADKVRRLCSGRIVVLCNSDDPAHTRLRSQLHRVGFYEIAEALDVGTELEFDNSSVSGLSTGQYELQARRPGFQSAKRCNTLIASRVALPACPSLLWTHVGNSLRLKHDGGLTACDDATIGLAICCGTHTGKQWEKRTVNATVSWADCGTDGSFAGIIGCYGGPGDSNMYAAIIDAFARPFAQVAIWRCDQDWERIAHTHLPLLPEPHDDAVPRSLRFSMAISANAVEVLANSQRVLWVHDTRIQRTHRFGVRMRGNKFTIQGLESIHD